MLFRPIGAVGYVFIVLAMLTKIYKWTDSLLVAGLLAFAGLICFGLAENGFGKRHWLVKYTDYAPLVVFGFAFALQMSQQSSSAALVPALCIIPFSALSAYVSNLLARKKKYRTLRRIEEMLPDPPGPDDANRRY
ncbi:permease [Paenibacillus sp. ACRRX]|uniref:permease n=1 Tax=unclassified Paenibacillus TaxID=185978 RepID=UPI001EF698F6|nr:MULTISPECIES: permease [unclassified Paenibacillus]MCG7409015.1 permease [Paenibacillus sp. ACRRX]MDK8181986.1 permease [Paenibacillus sp. UMB4589-SE434]